jgi:DNA-binding response OmpR family regulator
MKCLVLDTNSTHLEQLGVVLCQYGHEAIACGDVWSAVALLKTQKVDLVICENDGVKAWHLSQLFLGNSAYKPYMVALTMENTPAKKSLCLENGYDVVATKPIELSSLLKWFESAREQTNMDNKRILPEVIVRTKESPFDAKAKRKYSRRKSKNADM